MYIIAIRIGDGDWLEVADGMVRLETDYLKDCYNG